MNELELKRAIARNITACRKQKGWTQMELAEKINYSDKSVSKWERAEGLPDVVVLTTLAGLFGVTVNDLLSDEEPCAPAPEGKEHSLRTKVTVLLLSMGLVWLVSTVVFFILSVAAPDMKNTGYAFIIALPVCAIVAVVFCCLWWGWLSRCTAVSALVWLCALCFNVFLQKENSVLIYAVAGVLQVLIILWYFLKTKPLERRADKSEEEDGTEKQ